MIASSHKIWGFALPKRSLASVKRSLRKKQNQEKVARQGLLSSWETVLAHQAKLVVGSYE